VRCCCNVAQFCFSLACKFSLDEFLLKVELFLERRYV
jgi:hypothetical protein